MGLWVYIGQTCSLLSLLESPCVSSSINGYGFSCWAVTWGPAAKCPDPTGDDCALTRALKLVSSSWLASSLILLVGQHYQDQLYPFIFLTGSLHTSKPACSTQVSVCRGCFPPLLCAVIRAGPQLWCNSSTSVPEWERCLCQEPFQPQLYGDAFSPKKWWLETASLCSKSTWVCFFFFLMYPWKQNPLKPHGLILCPWGTLGGDNGSVHSQDRGLRNLILWGKAELLVNVIINPERSAGALWWVCPRSNSRWKGGILWELFSVPAR